MFQYWKLFTDYRIVKSFVRKLEVTNDCAERGVKLIDDFKNSTQNEQQRQYVFQIVEHHRRMLSSLNKENLQSVGRKL